MPKNFLSILDGSNSSKDENTNEITILVPTLQTEGEFIIDSSCTIKSNCNTIITCEKFIIASSAVSLSSLSFENAVEMKDVENCTLTNCSISQGKNASAALMINNCVNITLSHINVSDCTNMPGIYIQENSVVLADHLHVHNLSDTLVVVKVGSFVTVSDSTFHHSEGNGFYVYGQSSIEIFKCDFSHTVYSSIFVTNSQSNIHDNEFHDISKNGVSIENSDDFTIEKNHFTNIGDTAVRIFEHSIGTVRGNKIHEVEGNGINCNESDVLICDNDIFKLSYPAIAIISNSNARILNNKVSTIEYSGIVARNAKDVLIEGTMIEDVKQSGISISDTVKCVIQKNKISNCEVTSIEGYNESKLYIYENDISRIGRFAFLAYTLGSIEVKNNTIEKVELGMAKLAYKGSGHFTNNSVSECSSQCECQTSSSYFFADNGDFPGVTNDPKLVSEKVALGEAFASNEVLCLKCKKEQRSTYLLDCGHKAYCKECAEESLANGENCPLCRFPIVKVSNGFGVSNDDNCIICLENKVNTIVLPCGHMGVCDECIENWFKNKKCCPICRAEPCFYKKIMNDI